MIHRVILVLAGALATACVALAVAVGHPGPAMDTALPVGLMVTYGLGLALGGLAWMRRG